MIGKDQLEVAWWEQSLLSRERALPAAGSAPLAGLPGVAELLSMPTDETWPSAPATLWLRTIRDGDRDEYETRIFGRHAVLTRAVIRALVEPAPEALDRVVDCVIGWCEQTSWCWPAHDDARARGHHLPDIDHPNLDLGAGEVAAQLAWTAHLLGDALEERAPGVRRRIELEVSRRIFEPFEERDDWHWLGYSGRVHNWLPWVCSNVVTAALVLEPDATRRARVVTRAVAGLDRYLESLPADGAIDEGFSYWWNGAGRLLESLEMLRGATGGAFDAWLGFPVLRETVRFPLRMHLGGGWFVNHADGSAKPTNDLAWPSLQRAARALGQGDVAEFAAGKQGAGLSSSPAQLGRVILEVLDDGAGRVPAGGELIGDGSSSGELTTWLPSVQVGIARERTDGSGLTMVVKGGHNDENHNHNDVGSLIVALDGVPVIVDAGRPTYTARTFTEQRYDIWTMQSDWHNVPAPAGNSQVPGRDAQAQEVRFDATPDGARFEVELREAYPESSLESWRRRVELERAQAQVRVVDEWRFAEQPGQASLTRLVVAGEIEQVGELECVVDANEGAGRVVLTSSHPIRITTRQLDDPMLTQVWGSELHRLEVNFGTSTAGSASITVARLQEDNR